MKEIIAYEMVYNKSLKYQNDVICVPFQKEYWNEYMKIYNVYMAIMSWELKIDFWLYFFALKCKHLVFFRIQHAKFSLLFAKKRGI